LLWATPAGRLAEIFDIVVRKEGMRGRRPEMRVVGLWHLDVAGFEGFWPLGSCQRGL
jgi:hypothetical protein